MDSDYISTMSIGFQQGSASNNLSPMTIGFQCLTMNKHDYYFPITHICINQYKDMNTSPAEISCWRDKYLHNQR